MSGLIIAGDVSGSVTLQAPSAAGSVVLNLPTASGTVALTSGASAFTDLTVTNGATIQGLTVGKGAGAVATNTAVGASALGNGSQSGTNNTAVGNSVMAANTSGGANMGIGDRALASNTTGSFNSGAGVFALRFNTTGANNTAFGKDALQANTTASNNTAVGYQSLYANTTAFANTAVGYQAGYTNTTGVANTIVGYQAGYSCNSDGNAFFGRLAGNVATGSFNNFLGFNAGYVVTTGSKNTIIGSFGGNQGGLDIRTASNYIVLSDGDGNPRGWWDSNGLMYSQNTYSGNNPGINSNMNATSGKIVAFGANFNGYTPNNTTSCFFVGGDTTVNRFVAYSNGGLANYSANNANLSDRREKTNFAPAKSYLDVICAIPVQTYNYIDQNMEEDAGLTLGVVAQDVQEVAPELVTESNWGTEENPKMRLSIYQTDMQYALMKALQELKAEFDAYKATHP